MRINLNGAKLPVNCVSQTAERKFRQQDTKVASVTVFCARFCAQNALIPGYNERVS